MDITVAQLLSEARMRLSGLVPLPGLEGETLLGHVLGKGRSELHAWPEARVPEVHVRRFRALLEQRRQGVPVAYLTGRREFWDIALEVSPHTLIPRPETEHLVEAALERLPGDETRRIADLGTGTGAIALTLAKARPRCRVVATDLSREALAVARRNAARLGLQNVEFRQGDWYRPVAGERFHLIVSNPPYIPQGDPHLGQGDVRFEPRLALEAGRDGLEALRAIVRGAPRHLLPGGALLVEHGYDQKAAVQALFREAGFEGVATLEDLQGHPRVSLGTCAFPPLG